MKIFVILMLICSFASAGDKKDSKVLWKQLNVAVENAYANVRSVYKKGKDGESRIVRGEMDYSAVSVNSIKKIDDALDELVKAGVFLEIKIKVDTSIKPKADFGKNFGMRVDLMRAKYGNYVAMEMLMSELKKAKSPEKQSLNRTLHIRAPKVDVEFLDKLLKNSGILVKEPKEKD